MLFFLLLMCNMSGFSRGNATIIRGSVYESNIDMQGKVIINHGTPTGDLNVVNKYYCDNNRTPLQTTTVVVELTGTGWVDIINMYTGDFHISVVNVVTDGPCANFTASKNSQSRGGVVSRWSSMSGITSEERLEVRWLSNSVVQLRKNGTGYSGMYTVKYQL